MRGALASSAALLAGLAALVAPSLSAAQMNRPPVGVDDAYVLVEDATLDVAAPGVLANDSDPDGDELRAGQVSGTAWGEVELGTDGSLHYVPSPEFNGNDSFSYSVSDGEFHSEPITIAFTVLNDNAAPTAVDDAYATDEGRTLSVAAPGVLGNDSDSDGDGLRAVLWVGPDHGSLSLDQDGSFAYTPADGYSGPDEFAYAAADDDPSGNLESNLAKVSLTVRDAPDAPAVVRGLADFHNHQFAHLGFGGQLLTHDVRPGGPCRPPLPHNASTFRVKDLVRQGLLDAATKQAERGQCFPTATNLAGQQMDTNSLRRAWRYGLRLMVVHAVNSEFLCRSAELQPTFACRDPRAIDAQLKAARDLEREIDAEAGGPGQGWYRIVTTPEDARRVIGAGKLAVVLGVEAANAYGGCTLQNVPPPVLGVPNLIGIPALEARFRFTCNPPLLQTIGASHSIARFERYWALGARHFFLVHNVEGAAGGNAISNPQLHGLSNPSRLAPGRPFDRVAQIDRVIREVRPALASRSCPAFEFDGGRCNQLGLTGGNGLKLAQALADAGAMIDLDHLSATGKSQLTDPTTGIGAYPLVSSHSGFAAINHGDKSNEDQLTPAMLTDVVRSGGALGPILHQADTPGQLETYPSDATVARHTCTGTTESYVQAYRYAVNALRTIPRADGTPAYVGVGYGSDFNGLAGWPEGRFDTGQTAGGGSLQDWVTSWYVGPSRIGPAGQCYPAVGGFPAIPAHVRYPFTSPLTGASFGRSMLPWSGRTAPYDVSTDGVAHIGMIPDLVEEMKVLGLTEEELEPLWHGAEAYIRTWEAAVRAGHATTREANPDTCRRIREPLQGDDFVPLGESSGWVLRKRDELHGAGCWGLP
jgi:microsomal dipeptidase-like Zn-dependent dipeptidase